MALTDDSRGPEARARNLRLIARLDVKGPNLIKGIRLEGLRVIGDPQSFARRYYDTGADEIIYMDIVASLYGRNNLEDVVRHTAEQVFVPITVGGGVRSAEDARRLLRAGADKVAINTAATRCPSLISELARIFGSQCIVLSIEAKTRQNRWEVFTDNGREPTGLDVIAWAQQAESLGAGEILLTSVDREGTAAGFDVRLCRAVTNAVGIPVIASGGMGRLENLSAVVEEGRVDAVAMAHVLHDNIFTLPEVRDFSMKRGFAVRHILE